MQSSHAHAAALAPTEGKLQDIPLLAALYIALLTCSPRIKAMKSLAASLRSLLHKRRSQQSGAAWISGVGAEAPLLMNRLSRSAAQVMHL